MPRLTYAASLAAAKAGVTENGCWPWPKISQTGYPTCVKLDGRAVSAHVAVFVREVGPVPEGLTLDHLCHTRSALCPGGRDCLHRRCVRPDHLEPVTVSEQQIRHRDRTGACGNGHVRTEQNVLWVTEPKSGSLYRQCRECNDERYQNVSSAVLEESTLRVRKVLSGMSALLPGGNFDYLGSNSFGAGMASRYLTALLHRRTSSDRRSDPAARRSGGAPTRRWSRPLVLRSTRRGPDLVNTTGPGPLSWGNL